jgi:RND family efflux transporter MFP subunit
VLLMLLAGCKPAADATAASQEVPKVTVTKVVSEADALDFDQFIGEAVASESVDVRSRVYGFIQSVDFKDGDRVKENEPLFTIEPDDYNAIHEQSLSRIGLWEAKEELARANLARYAKLLQTKSVSREEYDETVAAVREAEAGIKTALADAKRSALDVKYTKVLAPISGRIDRAQVTKGDLVIGGQAGGTMLTRIVQEQPMYVYFDVDEASLLRYKRMRPANSTAPPGSLRELNIDCFVQLADEKDFPHKGKLDFISNRLDAGTGTATLRAVFENKDYAINDGMYVNVRVPVGKAYAALLIPEQAIGTSQDVKFVYVVEGGVAQRRPIELGPQRGEMRIVTSGLKLGEEVIVKGQQRVRPNQKVEAEMAPQRVMASKVPAEAEPAPGAAASAADQAPQLEYDLPPLPQNVSSAKEH